MRETEQLVQRIDSISVYPYILVVLDTALNDQLI